MKIKFLMAGLLGLVSATTFAQTKDLKNALTEMENAQTLRNQQPMVTLYKGALAKAKVLIDKAVADPKNATLAQTYAVKGDVYAWLAVTDSVATSSATSFTAAEEALKKAIELDTKKEFTKLIEDGRSGLAQYQLTIGVKAYQNQKFDVAYTAFDYYRSILPEDTTAIYYTGLAAANSKNYPAAITNYNKLVTTKFSGSEGIYDQLSGMYLMVKDTANALKVIGDALVKYPNNSGLRKKEIEIALQTGKSQEVISKITAAIEKDSKNKELYYYAGLVYSQTGDAAGEKVKGTKDAAGKAALKAKKAENYDKAAEMYKKALEIDPNYFDANLNMGYILMAPGIEAFNAAANLPTSATQKQYDALIAKAGTLFDVAKPYLEKAVTLKPGSRDALTNLVTFYRGKRDQPNIDKYTKLLEAAKD